MTKLHIFVQARAQLFWESSYRLLWAWRGIRSACRWNLAPGHPPGSWKFWYEIQFEAV